MDLVRFASGVSALRMPIAQTSELLVSSCDTHVFSVCPEPLVMRASQARYFVYTLLLFSVGVRLLSDFFPSFCLFVWVVSRGSTTGSNDDVQPRIVHSDCGVTIKVTAFAPI